MTALEATGLRIGELVDLRWSNVDTTQGVLQRRDARQQVLMDWLGHQESRMIWHSYHLRQDEARRQMDQILSVGIGLPANGAAEDGAVG